MEWDRGDVFQLDQYVLFSSCIDMTREGLWEGRGTGSELTPGFYHNRDLPIEGETISYSEELGTSWSFNPYVPRYHSDGADEKIRRTSGIIRHPPGSTSKDQMGD